MTPAIHIDMQDEARVLSRPEALAVLALHNLKPDQPTSWYPETRVWNPQSTFDLEVGLRESYTMAEIRNWLGY